MFHTLLDHSQQHPSMLLFSHCKTNTKNSPLAFGPTSPVGYCLFFCSPLQQNIWTRVFFTKCLQLSSLLLTPSPIILGKLLLWRQLSPLHCLFPLPEMPKYFPRYLCGLTFETQWGLSWPSLSAPSSPYPAVFSLEYHLHILYTYLLSLLSLSFSSH